jgi:hypothetical protein
VVVDVPHPCDFHAGPGAVTLATGQTGLVFTTTGGSPPIRWGIHDDETCARGSERILCSSIDGGAFTPGPKTGTAIVVAIDQDDSYVTAEVTVVDAGADGSVPAVPSAGCRSDAAGADGSMSVSDGSKGIADAQGLEGSEADSATDAQGEDSSSAPGGRSSNNSGCGCSAAGAQGPSVSVRWLGCALLSFRARRGSFNRRRRHQG